MNNFIKKIVKKLLKLYCNNLKINPKTILILENSFPSGSNTNIIYKRLKETNKYKIEYMDEKKLLIKNKNILEILRYIKLIIRVSKFNVIVCSHGFRKYNNKQILIDLWHGIPLKAMRYMETNADEYKWENFNTDFLITTSKVHSVLMGATTHIPYSKHKILGNPRNDYFFAAQEKNDSFEFLNAYDKVLLYMPTFRQGYLNRVEGKIYDNIFNFENFLEQEFINYLKLNNYVFLLKLHPMEEEKFKEKYLKYNDNIKFLSTDVLKNLNIDLYQLLPKTDLLITDYSSVFFDYLLLDKPIVFINNDIEEYRKKRGILLEPYELWTPGYKVNNQKDLIEAIEKSFTEDGYRNDRMKLKEIFHYHKDGNSTIRVLNLIDELLLS